MYIPPQVRGLMARQNGGNTIPDTNSQASDRNIIFVIVALAIVVTFLLLGASYFGLKYLRRMGCSPKYLPGKYLKDKWNRWDPGKFYNQVSNDIRNGSATGAEATEMITARTTNPIHRDASIRSVATLPAYSANPKPEERVIAREGERDGMDTVIEFPETAEEEEARREELMASLYEIRQRRREELAEREARRQARREARERGDRAQLELLRQQDRLRARQRARSRSSTNASNSASNLATALAEHQSRGRGRRIASVNYADVGYVRHDGSRVRATSPDSDRRPLLSNGPSGSFDASNRSSMVGTPSIHSWGESYSSASTGTVDPSALTRVHSQTHSTASTLPSTPGAEEADVGVLSIPPPEYDHLDWGEAPPYQSPVEERNENTAPLRELTVVPTIHIDAASPISDNFPAAAPHESREQHDSRAVPSVTR
ncbi:hypothetical protein KXV81_009409 [Aspergillus fumigatus]|nr:hypothetical protein KXX68_009465 [Aspergillus fumigatus]KAH1479222.1 hypothetical protein KXX26_000424 [Aspergillus fumigatus]KAH1844176.1 hypothetical protein KXX43_007164 [Aspergillus fumigatus]KAH2417984.1 hypothetical protein KXV53_000227 [Aspergillus fumigatus]KAH3404480.1 hypothetical protein KXV81_009409 [Aspergillus fumigatus]